jgi:uncharacterized membrane protein
MSGGDEKRGSWDRLTETFLAGVLGILPLALTVAVLAWVVGFVHDLAGPSSACGKLLQSVGMTVSTCELTAYVLGLITAVVLVYVLGVMVQHGAGRRWQSAFDGALHRIPVLGTVYDASKNLSSVFDRRKDSLQGMQPVICYFGDDGVAATPALMPTPDLVRMRGKDYHVVIIPTAPVPFGGALFCVKAEWVKPADCSFDELVGIYMSMGFSAPKCLGRGEAGSSE